MSHQVYPTDVLEQARAVLEAWKQISPTLTLGELNLEGLKADIDAAVPLVTQIMALEAQLTDLRNQRDALYEELWNKVKRTRSGVKGIYGDDSSEYEMVGGTRKSERKPRSQKPPVPVVA